jgi:RimJ/RimL family protein N-acetyltransferase
VTDWRHHRTGRLWLEAPQEGDLPDLHAIHGDPASWTHFPQGRHLDLAATRELLERQQGRWAERGLGYWVVREHDGGPVVGLGGCAWRQGWPGWNLAYRLAAQAQGRGYATELGRAALAAAAAVAPDRPVVAYLLEHNHASRRTTERLGLTRQWRGPDAGNEDPDAVRLVYADRPLAEDLLARVVAG